MEDSGNPFLSISKQQHRRLSPLPAHPNPNASQINASYQSIGADPLHSRSRSRSQPAFFSLDSLPPLNYRADSSPTTSLSDSVSADVSTDDHDVPSSLSPPLPPSNAAAGGAFAPPARDGLPPRKAHRRSQSDVPFAFFPPSLPLHAAAAAPLAAGLFLDPAKLTATGVKVENHRDRGFDADGVTGDDLINAYMNLDGLVALNSSEDNHEDLNSRDSGSKTNVAESSENEADSDGKGHKGDSITGLCANDASRKEGMKRSAAGDPAEVMARSRHCRSLSMDSFMRKFNVEETPPKLRPRAGLRAGQNSKASALDAVPSTFSLEFGNGQFSAAEMKKIMENEKLVEMAMTDPKRVKRILANRQSAARSKERKVRYIAELEHKVQALQTQATTLSTQVTFLQRDSTGLATQNNELKFRLQAMEQQAQLRDALNAALTVEVQRLKLAATGLGDSHTSNSLNQQASVNPQIFQLQQKQQLPHIAFYQVQKPDDDAVMDSRSE